MEVGRGTKTKGRVGDASVSSCAFNQQHPTRVAQLATTTGTTGNRFSDPAKTMFFFIAEKVFEWTIFFIATRNVKGVQCFAMRHPIFSCRQSAGLVGPLGRGSTHPPPYRYAERLLKDSSNFKDSKTVFRHYWMFVYFSVKRRPTIHTSSSIHSKSLAGGLTRLVQTPDSRVQTPV